MVVTLLLTAVSGVVLVWCLQVARSRGWRVPGLSTRQRDHVLPTPPPDDLPPAGLTPLIPSPRAIASECERGLRELTLFLAVQPRD
ncbi:MAG: hypothetical protein NVS3B26_11130 [Mycobacteriales bacterium]